MIYINERINKICNICLLNENDLFESIKKEFNLVELDHNYRTNLFNELSSDIEELLADYNDVKLTGNWQDITICSMVYGFEDNEKMEVRQVEISVRHIGNEIEFKFIEMTD